MRALLSLALVLAIAATATAEECVVTTSFPEVNTCPLGVQTVSPCQYVDNDLCQPECVFSIWWYMETNDMEGLQRNDENRDDVCGQWWLADTIVS